MQTLEGTQLGNYDVIRRIRVGGMGAVYEGRQRTAFGRKVAIKVILGNYARDREMRRRFAREAKTVAQLHHPHILPLIEFGDEQGLLYLVMPYIDGGTLTSYLRHSLPDLNVVANIFLQLLDAVEYAHEEGLIHRDIKSSNVLLEMRRSGTPHAYLADFGLVRTMSNMELEEAGKPIPLDQVPGTPHYMAPEQTRGIITPATDIYALGVLLYQMLIGELPYDDPDDVKVVKMHLHAPVPSPCDCDASIPYELGEVVRTAMAKRPEQRFASVAEMREAFLAALDGPVILPEEEDEFDEPFFAPETPLPERRLSMPLSAAVAEPQESRINLPKAGSPQRRTTSSPPFMPPVIKKTGRARNSKSKRLALLIVATVMVPVLLLALILIPRLTGWSLFPSSVPLIGASPNATISITLKSNTLKDTFLLTASPNVSSPDLGKRVIPDRLVTASANGVRVVPTTGIRTIPAVQASGQLFFDNPTQSSFTEPEGTVFKTSGGLQVRLAQTVNIPPRRGDNDGNAYASAVAVLPGTVGNIPSGVINTTCCNGVVTVTNPAPFHGGVDEQFFHVVAQADLDGVRDRLIQSLQQQALQKIQAQLSSDEVRAASPSYISQVLSNVPVGASANQVQVQVSVTGSAVVYSLKTVHTVAEQLLTREAVQAVGANYHLKGTVNVDPPAVISLAQKATVYLSISAQGLWVYNLNQQQVDAWRASIKGTTPQLAKAFLRTQAGVADVQIQMPFGADHLPTSPDEIQMVLVNA
jgi:serine/threonine protein kinase